MKPPYDVLDRFWAKVDRRGQDECWNWRGSLITTGYGQFYLDRAHRTVLAHRVSYEWAKGRIPNALTIDHLCRNRLCVNPAHLEAVTLRENVRRASADKTHCVWGHLLPETRNRQGRRPCVGCARLRVWPSRKRVAA